MAELFSLLRTQLLGTEQDDSEQLQKGADKRQRLHKFWRLPMFLEGFLSFGVLTCVDVILYVLCFLPIRVLVSLFTTLRASLSPVAPAGKHQRRGGGSGWTRRKTCDLLRVALILLGVVILFEVNTSRFYHFVRGQTVIKLYVVFNMLEIFDRLLCSIGEDILDSLFTAVTEMRMEDGNLAKDGAIVLMYFVLSVFYVVLHSLVLLGNIITLNVALNSKNNSLLVLLISNNFVELKANIFKRFRKVNLMQLACSDVSERVQLTILFICIAGQNLTHIGLANAEEWLLETFLWSVATVIICELFVDWIKHGFITKFNQLELSVYSKYTHILSCDVLSAYMTDEAQYGATVCRRFGFPVTPLCAVLLRVFLKSFPHVTSVAWSTKVGVVLLVWACGVTAKMGLYMVLLGRSYGLVEGETSKAKAVTLAQRRAQKQQTGSAALSAEPTPFVLSRAIKSLKTGSWNTPMRQETPKLQRRFEDSLQFNNIPPLDLGKAPSGTFSSPPLTPTKSLRSMQEDLKELTPAPAPRAVVKRDNSPDLDLSTVDRYGLYTNRMP